MNTIQFTVVSTAIALGLSVLMAWASSHLHKKLRAFFCSLFCLASASYILPQHLSTIFSSDVQGVLNSYLLRTGIIKKPIPFLLSPEFIRILSVLMPVIIGLGPLYLILTLAFSYRSKWRFYTHLAVSLQAVIAMISVFSVAQIAGFPTSDYSGHTLLSSIYDHMMIRFEAGYASALIVVLGIITVLLVALLNVIVYWASMIVKTIGISQADKARFVLGNTGMIVLRVGIFIVMLLFLCLLMYPYVQMILDSFKPINEIFLFPRRVWPIQPTWENYKKAFQSVSGTSLLLDSGIIFFASTLIMYAVSILCGFGFAFDFKGRKLLLGSLAFSFILSPVLLLSFEYFLKGMFITIATLLITSPGFGLAAYFSALIFKHCTKGSNSLRDFFSSRKRLSEALLAVLAISMLASLTTWLYVIAIPMISNHSLIQAIRQASQTGDAALLVLSTIFPLFIVLSAIPIFMNVLQKEHL